MFSYSSLVLFFCCAVFSAAMLLCYVGPLPAFVLVPSC
jgi:hypothetical protein